MSVAARNNTEIIKIHQLPYGIHRELGLLLDQNEQWKVLGGVYLDIQVPELDRIGKAYLRKESPTEELLKQWGSRNPTVLDLFRIMNKMKQYQAMKLLKPFVDERYHRVIYEGISRMEIDSKSDRFDTSMEMVVKSRNSNPNPSPRRPVDNPPPRNQRGTSNTERSRDALDVSEFGSGLPYIDYQQLTEGTDNWHRKNFLGQGGFGVVFKGLISQTPMAIKRLEPQKGNELEFNALAAQKQQLFRELKYLNSHRHDNILPLYGYSVGENKCCLIYQYMPNGSLDDRLQCKHGSLPIPWNLRYIIARGTARGIQFLHGRDKPLVHGDIKSANILLDQGMEPKIGDFGLAREGPTQNYTHVKVSSVNGTRPYLPVEFLRGKKFSTKVDTYSFGVVLFEIATGLRAYDHGREGEEKYLKEYICNYNVEKLMDVIDPKIGRENSPLFKILIDVGKDCVAKLARSRPEMKEVSKRIDDTCERIKSLIQASYTRTANSFYDPTLLPRRPSLQPSGSLIYATPPASNLMYIHPPPFRHSPSPINPGVTVPGIREVSEENENKNPSKAVKIPTPEVCVPNTQCLPSVLFTQGDKSVSNANSSARQTSRTSSVSYSDSNGYSDESSEQNQNHISRENYTDSSMSELIPNLTIMNLL